MKLKFLFLMQFFGFLAFSQNNPAKSDKVLFEFSQETIVVDLTNYFDVEVCYTISNANALAVSATIDNISTEEDRFISFEENGTIVNSSGEHCKKLVFDFDKIIGNPTSNVFQLSTDSEEILQGENSSLTIIGSI